MPLLLRKCAPSVSIEQLALKAPPPSLKSLARNMTCSMKKSEVCVVWTTRSTILKSRKPTKPKRPVTRMAEEAEDIDTRDDNKPQEDRSRDDLNVSLMGNVLEKLRVMNYEREFSRKKNFAPYTETQFAFLPPNGNPSAQFKSFLDLVGFLMKLCNQDFVVDKYDDPNTSVNKLILSLKVMGFSLDFPTSKFKLGHGEAVCASLDFLCDKALAARNFAWNRPLYPKEEFAEEAEVDEAAEVDTTSSAAENIVNEEEEEEALYSDIIRGKMETKEVLEESFQQMIVSEMDPLIWKSELERVGPRLVLKQKEYLGGSSGASGPMTTDTAASGAAAAAAASREEWHSHIEKMKTNNQILEEKLPTSQKQLQFVASQLTENIAKMNSKENAINKQYDQLRQEYHQLRDKFQLISDKNKEVLDRVNQITNELAQLNDQLKEVKAEMDAKGNKMTDTSPLVQIKDALKNLSQEIRTLELHIGVVAHTLLQAKSKSSGLRSKQNEFASNASGNDPENESDKEL